MLNINAFFEFKQRTRHVHSFQLAQLIYHAQHLNDYYTLPQQVTSEVPRRISLPPADDPVGRARHLLSLFLSSPSLSLGRWILIFRVFVCMLSLANLLEMVIHNTFSDFKCKDNLTRAETRLVCSCVCATLYVWSSHAPTILTLDI